MEASFISTLDEAVAWRDKLDAEGKKLVLTNGCFDLLHVGHVRYLREARAMGDALLLALNGDESVRELKGEGRPLNKAEDRAELLCALEAVDRVIVFEGKRLTAEIEAIRPHIYTKGGDYTENALNREEHAALVKAGTDIRILSLVPGKSTSETLKKMTSENSESTPNRKPRLAVLGSGTGSNFAAILDAIDAGSLEAEIAIVISDIEDARILDLARERSIPAIHVDPGSERRGRLSEPALKEIVDRLKAASSDIVALAGFMRIVRPPLLDAFAGRILNIHPSLLPKFPGLEAWTQALEAGETESGCTVHLVDAGVDTGPILGQARVPVLPGDTPQTLHARIQEQEHELYPQMVRKLWEKISAS